MAGRLEGRAAIVTGAGSIGPGWGNGKAAAALFAREGAEVLCADINLAAAQETAEIITGEGTTRCFRSQRDRQRTSQIDGRDL